MTLLPQLFGLVGFGAAFVSYTGVLILVLASHPATRQAYLLIAALVVSMIWSGSIAYLVWADSALFVWLPAADALHAALWVAFLCTLLMSGEELSESARRIGIGILSLSTVCLLSVLLVVLSPVMSAGAQGGITLISLLMLPLLGLLALEQVLRNSGFLERRVVRPLALGVGLIFVLDVVCYSQLFIFSDVNVLTWQLRGLGNAVAAPFILIALKRQREWERELFLSRQIVFHSASLVAAGIYLLVLGVAGSLIGPFDDTGRALLELAVLLSAGTLFVYALFSTTLRRRFKVFIAKHFYRNRYDYRQEWLRLIETLAGGDAEKSVSERGVKALAEIIESPGGELWWADEPNAQYEPCGTWRISGSTESFAHGSELIRFLVDSFWVIDTDEYSRNPEVYQNAFDADDDFLAKPSVFIPLILEGALRGIVRLERRSDLGSLSFEDHDLLKTAGKQVAVFVAQERVQERLAETKQFEAFSRLTTFLMHDLKNLISQQELVVGNARRYKHKPEFVDDAIRTIESSIRRMRAVLDRLQSHGRGDSVATIDLGKLLVEVVNSCCDRSPAPSLQSMPANIFVSINRERLAMALTHVIRNAQDATGADGSIEIGVFEKGGAVFVEISDTGSGMTDEFIRARLFRPFDSTKGAQGMGIGAYQLRETFRAAGGDVQVSSVLGRGTTFRLLLPLSLARSVSGTAEASA